MKVYVANNLERQMIEIALGFGVINSLTVADAIELRDKLDEQIRAVQLLHAPDKAIQEALIKDILDYALFSCGVHESRLPEFNRFLHERLRR